MPENDASELKLQKEIWAKAIDTQMHFNEMSVRSRQLGLSFVVAALGVVVVLLTKDEARVALCGFSTHAAGPILLFVAFGLYAVKLLDLGVYHPMLRGAVAFNEALEKLCIEPKLMGTEKGLTQTVSVYSRFPYSTNKEKFVEDGGKVSAEKRVTKFYRFSIGVLVALALLLSWALGHRVTVGD